MARRWLLEMPPGMLLLNANQRFHWSEKNRRAQTLRQASMVLARNARIPRLERARIAVEYQPPRKSRARDAGNWAPSGKALIDGLRDAGVLPDDDSSHLLSEEYRIGQPYERGRMLLHITEVPQ
jgi:crossover junction endodeoxyribonuclease RusA